MNLFVLLADDDKDDCLLFKEALEELAIPAQLSIVYDGEQLMKMLLNKADNLPDVLFLDLNMPRKNGFECLSEIRLNPKLQKLLVIIFSTSSTEHIVNELYKDGAQHFICKPNKFSELKAVIELALTKIVNGNSNKNSKDNFLLEVDYN